MKKYTKLKDKFKKMWEKKEFVLWGIVIIWTTLFWEGHRIIPGAKWLSEVIPLWIVIINLAVFFISIIVLITDRYLSPIGIIIIILIVLLFTSIFFSIGYERFPVISIIGAGFVLLLSVSVRIWRFKYQRRE